MFLNPSELAVPPWSLLIKRAVAHLELHQGQGEEAGGPSFLWGSPGLNVLFPSAQLFMGGKAS